MLFSPDSLSSCINVSLNTALYTLSSSVYHDSHKQELTGVMSWLSETLSIMVAFGYISPRVNVYKIF